LFIFNWFLQPHLLIAPATHQLILVDDLNACLHHYADRHSFTGKTMSTYKSVISLLATMSLGFVSLTQASEIDIYQNSESSDIRINHDVNPNDIDVDLRQIGSSNSIGLNFQSPVTANILQNANHSTIDMLILESVGLLDIKQYGHSNQIEANVSDSVSRIDLNQSGDDNILNIDIDNALDFLDVNQYGNSNNIEFKHSGYGGTSALTQGGSGNSLEVITSSGGLSVNVTQEGTGSSVKIINGFENL